MSNWDIQLSPVGVVRAGPEGFSIVLEPQFRAALNGLEGFSHVNVLWWSHFLDRPEQRQVVECERPYSSAPETLGIFATRSPSRPNPIALSVSQVVHIDPQEGILSLAYIDAEDGTPVLDIKPYQPCSDRVRDVSVPAWCQDWPEWYEDSAEFDWSTVFVNAQ